MTDLTALTDAEVLALLEQVSAEYQRRSMLKHIPEQMADLNKAYQSSSGYEDGQPWVQPVGAVGAYMTGDTVTHRDAEWRSLIDFNVTEPGDEADPQAYRWWQNLTDQPEEGAWAPGVDYAVGQIVTYDGTDYECVQGHTSQPGWTPDAVPSLWQPVEGA